MTHQDQKDSSSLETAPALVICVHGTGAAARSTAHPHWWQPTSDFARRVKEVAGRAVRIAKPQRWSGFNLESSRRRAGRELWRRLARLEDRGIEYHLVGHSHGGSVIWHALVESARANRKLNGLKSWTTVGTPFLSFRPDPTAWWRLVSFIIAAVAGVWISSQIIEIGRERTSLLTQFMELSAEGQFYALIAVVLLLLVLLRAAYLFVLVARHAYDIARHFVLRAAEKRAADWYGGGWIALWHERDEAIAGLRASLVSSPQLLPRWTSGKKATLKRILFWAYDRGFAQAVDQFVWAVGMQRAQGIDVFDQRMDRAQHCPPALAPGWAPLPASMASALTKSADAGAAAATAAFRERLSTAGDFQHADEVFSSFATTWTWQELIHTSYFEQESVVELIADRFKGPGSATIESTFTLSRLPAEEPRPLQPGAIFALPLNRALASLGITVLLTISAVSTYKVAIAPYTTRFLIEQVATETANATLASATLASVPNNGVLGELVLRLAALGKVPDLKQKLDEILDRKSKEEAALLFARAFGRLFPNTDALLTPELIEHRAQAFPAPNTELAKAYREAGEKDRPLAFIQALGVYPYYRYQSEILAGLVETNKKPTPEFVADLERNIEAQRATQLANASSWESEAASNHPDDKGAVRQEVTERILDEQFSGSILSAATDLLIVGYADEARRIIDTAFQWNGRRLSACDRSRFDYIKRAATYGTMETIDKLPFLCGKRRIFGGDLTDAAFAAYRANKIEMAGALLDLAQTANRDFQSSADLWRFSMLQLDRGKLPEAIVLIEKWLKFIDGRPDEVMRQRGRDLFAKLAAMTPGTEEDRARLQELKIRVGNSIVEVLQKALADRFSLGLSQDTIVKELVSLYMALDRPAEAVGLAETSMPPPAQPEGPDPFGIGSSRRDEERRNRAQATMRVGLLYETAKKPSQALEAFRAALPLIEGVWARERYEAGCSIYIAALPADRALAHRAIDAAAAQAAREPDLGKRAGMFGNLAFVAAQANEPRRAAFFAARAALPDVTLYGYAIALDQIIRTNDRAAYQQWGFAGYQLRPLAREYLKVDDLPKCISD